VGHRVVRSLGQCRRVAVEGGEGLKAADVIFGRRAIVRFGDHQPAQTGRGVPHQGGEFRLGDPADRAAVFGEIGDLVGA